jgi:hypothetical protein
MTGELRPNAAKSKAQPKDYRVRRLPNVNVYALWDCNTPETK